MNKMLLIDGMAVVYRAYYALNRAPRINSKGQNTSAILGFTTTLYDLIKNLQPTHVGVAFDLPKPTFRHELYPQYKANRDAMPEVVQQSIPWIHDIISAFRIPLLTCEGYEADDIIGTISHQADEAQFGDIILVSPDKDFAQLVTPNVRLYRFGRMGKPDQIMGVSEVLEKFSISECSQVIDLLGLWGDSSDNIPGVPGIGEKTAKKLIAQFGSIEELVDNTTEIKNQKTRALIENNRDSALFSKKLATICLDAPIDISIDNLKLEKPDYKHLKELTDQLEFRNFAKRVFTDLSLSEPSQINAFSSDFKGENVKLQSSAVKVATLFDNIEPIEEAPQTECDLLTVDVLSHLKGKDIAIAFDGANILLAENADNIWKCAVGNLPLESFQDLIADADKTTICFDVKNLKYALQELGCTIGGYVFDIQLSHYLIDAEARHSFDYICSAYLNYNTTNAIQKISALWQLYPILLSKMREANLENIYNTVEYPLVDVLISMEQEGVRIDKDALNEYSIKLNTERQSIENKIFALAGGPFNINSPRQLGDILYEKLKVTEKPPRTATHQYSTAEETLSKLSTKHSIIPLILEYRSINKLLGTYTDSFPKLINPASNRLHTVYNQTITATGRLSSSNPNLQNIPIRNERGREIRKAFVPRDDCHLLLAADYSQIELRIIASLAHDQHMIQAFNNGIDIHASTASKIYRIPVDQVSKDQRRNAKSVNFGIIYGISSFGLSQQLNISRKEAANLIEQYYLQYPSIKDFINASVEFARTYGYAQTILGRRRYLPDINSRNAAARSFAERNAVNMPIQGTSADMIKLAMIAIHKRLKENNLQSKMILQVHDELVIDMPRHEEPIIRQIVATEMKRAMPLDGLEIEVGIEVGENWLEAH